MTNNTKRQQKIRFEVNPPVFFGSSIFIVLFLILVLLMPETLGAYTESIKNWITETAGWFYILAVAGFMLFIVLVAISGFGKIKLGPDHSKPSYSYASWYAMLFTAGMGIGLMFFGVAEPIMHYSMPPTGEPNTIAAARQAMQITFFHWGLHAWSIYAVVALSLAYFAYRHNLPLQIRSALYPLIGDKIYGPIGHAVDIFAVLGTIFGIATSLGFGVSQVNAGLNYLFGIPQTTGIQITLVVIISGIATLSVASGLDKGVKRLSELNMVLALLLMLFVLVTGPTVFVLQTFVQNNGMYLSNLFSMTFNLYAYEESGWIGGWTLFYWGWWIAWSPFVGMFIARVSRGRTVREFVLGMLLIPAGFTFLWMTVFGDTAIHMVLKDGLTQLVSAVQADTSVALFQFLEYLPLSSITSLLATVLIILFFVTSSDSGSLVVDMLTSGKQSGTPTWQRIFWAVLQGLIAAILLLAGGLYALQAATIASALPFACIMVFMCFGLFTAMRLDVLKKTSMQEARTTPQSSSSAPRSWQQRLRLIMHTPNSEADVLDFLEEKVKPALNAVARELKRQSIEATVRQDKPERIWLLVGHQEEHDFFYSVHAKPHQPPSFMTDDVPEDTESAPAYYRAEVHLKEGGQDYDIMDWTQEDIIQDLLDQYERHLHFLNVVR